MRVRCAVLVAVTSVLTVVSPVSAGQPDSPAIRSESTRSAAPVHTASGDFAFVRHEIWEVSLASFMATAQHPDGWFDWTTDWCSAPGLRSRGLTYDFRDPCRRHDFAYRNLKLLDRRYSTGHTFWNHTSRSQVDRQFLADMTQKCHHRWVLVRPFCLVWARVFYTAVRWFGGP